MAESVYKVIEIVGTSSESWEKAGRKELYQRACEQVDRRLAAYVPIATDAAVDRAMREVVMNGLLEQTELPELPPPPAPVSDAGSGGRRGRAGRRRKRGS